MLGQISNTKSFNYVKDFSRQKGHNTFSLFSNGQEVMSLNATRKFLIRSGPLSNLKNSEILDSL